MVAWSSVNGLSYPDRIQIGIDFGQSNDYTAIAVAHIEWRASGHTEKGIRYNPATGRDEYRDAWSIDVPNYTIRYMARLPLGLGYPQQVEEIIALLVRLRMDEMKHVSEGVSRELMARVIKADRTGVGRAVVDMLKDRMLTNPYCEGIRLDAVTFTAGDSYNTRTGAIAKSHIVNDALAKAQNGQIHLMKEHPDAAVVAHEFQDYRIHLAAATGQDTYGAFRPGAHDDYVTAIMLAVEGDAAKVGASVTLFPLSRLQGPSSWW